jgi:hypothetical protein
MDKKIEGNFIIVWAERDEIHYDSFPSEESARTFADDYVDEGEFPWVMIRGRSLRQVE